MPNNRNPTTNDNDNVQFSQNLNRERANELNRRHNLVDNRGQVSHEFNEMIQNVMNEMSEEQQVQQRQRIHHHPMIMQQQQQQQPTMNQQQQRLLPRRSQFNNKAAAYAAAPVSQRQASLIIAFAPIESSNRQQQQHQNGSRRQPNFILLMGDPRLLGHMVGNAGHHQQRGLSDAEFNALPSATYVSNNETNKACSICLDEFKPNDKLKILACAHKYHDACIREWLKQSRLCPLGKSDATKPSN